MSGIRLFGPDKLGHLVEESEVASGSWCHRILRHGFSSLLGLHSKSGPNQNGESYTDNMSQELIGIIIAAIALAAILVPGQWGMRKDIAALGESTRKDMSDLRKEIESVRKDIAALSERMARLEGLFEGFTKSSPQPTPQ